MAAGLDCVAVTDHNTGEWIDRLKTCYATMKSRAEQGSPVTGFRELTIFPGVELSVQGGVHVLAVFDPARSTADVDALLGSVQYRGNRGECDGVTSMGIDGVVADITAREGLPILAHADKEKGLLQCEPDSQRCRRDALTVEQALATEQVLALEWIDRGAKLPSCAESRASRLARVLGSDAHSFGDTCSLGRSFTWVKMAAPTLEGLRLALLDGNDTSIRRSDDGAFDPARVPEHRLVALEIQKARYMGRSEAARVEFSPFFNAVVGGRGTGKSTLVHSLRLVSGRRSELPKDTEAWSQFDAFEKVERGRSTTGALCSDTELRLEWEHGGERTRLSWRAESPKTVQVEEWRDESWKLAGSQNLGPARFPLRIFSQGQIAALSGSGRRTLLAIIDESGDISRAKTALEDARRSFQATSAHWREVSAKVGELPELERQLAELKRNLASLADSGHAAVLSAYGSARSQQREVELLLQQVEEAGRRCGALANEFVLDDWAAQHFTAGDADLLAWRRELDSYFNDVRSGLRTQAESLASLVVRCKSDPRYLGWLTRAQKATEEHELLQRWLADQGVEDPQAFARMTSELQILESRLKELRAREVELSRLEDQRERQRVEMAEHRRTISVKRREFLESVVGSNPHVRIALVPMGREPGCIARELRELLELGDDVFNKDIDEDGGIVHELAQSSEDQKESKLSDIQRKLTQPSEEFTAKFRAHLQKKLERPEFTDRVLAWSPEDDLWIEYLRGDRWTPVEQGSQGQRSAAMLAFLLAFGSEPVVLDQPEDDLDNHLIYDLIVKEIRRNKCRRQLIIVTHNANVVVNGDAELVHIMEFTRGQCQVKQCGGLGEPAVREEVCQVMEGGHEAFQARWKRLGGQG